MRRTSNDVTIKDDFRIVYFYGGPEVTLCDDCFQEARKTRAVAVALIPAAVRCLECEECLAVSKSMAVAESTELQHSYDEAREGGKRCYDLEPPALPKV